MITKKDLIVSVLCTFCLATVLFTMMPVQSAEWDPWLDVKEDGRINVLDLIKTASALGTMGDTTKNVSVTNWPVEPTPQIIKVCENYDTIYSGYRLLPFAADVSNYEFASIFVSFSNIGPSPGLLYCLPQCEGIAGPTDGSQDLYARVFVLDTLPLHESESLISTNFKVGAPYLSFATDCPTAGDVTLTIVVYCYN